MSKHYFSICMLSVLISPQLCAQDLPVLSGPFGNLVIPDIEVTPTPPVDIRSEALPRRGIGVDITPAFVYADGTEIFGSTLAKKFSFARKGSVSIDARYLHINPETSNSLDEWRFRGKYTLPKRSDYFSGAITVEQKSLRDVYDQVSILASWSYLPSELLTATLNLGFADRSYDAKPSVDDMTTGIGVMGTIREGIRVGIDYQLEDDISMIDNYSVTFVLRSLVMGAGKNDTYFVSYTGAF